MSLASFVQRDLAIQRRDLVQQGVLLHSLEGERRRTVRSVAEDTFAKKLPDFKSPVHQERMAIRQGFTLKGAQEAALQDSSVQHRQINPNHALQVLTVSQARLRVLGVPLDIPQLQKHQQAATHVSREPTEGLRGQLCVHSALQGASRARLVKGTANYVHRGTFKTSRH